MANVVRWDPFRDMMNLRRSMDRLFDDAMTDSETWQPVTWDLALDVVENEDEYLVRASLPGLNPDDLEVTYINNALTIKGEVKEENEVKESRYHLRERRYGSFARSILLPSNVSAEKIDANYENGVLTLKLPKVEEAKPKKISVKNSDVKMIDSTTSDIKTKN
jgi:HSP20 family protein